MRKQLTLLILLAVSYCSAAFASDAEPLQILSSPSDATYLPAGEKWPREVIACLRWLHAGMTREQVESRLEQDGGLYVPQEQRYFIKGLEVHEKVVMIDLFWKPNKMPDEIYGDKDLRAKWLVEHREWDGLGAKDVLKWIGKPYLSGVHID